MENKNDFIYQLSHDKNDNIYSKGYRIVYFYDDYYHVGEYCTTIEGFMIGLCDIDPSDDIPEFISIKDMLLRSVKNDTKCTYISLYKTDGKLIESLSNPYKL